MHILHFTVILGSQVNDDAIEIRRQRERIRSAAMTDEQRNERNKKRREASYKRKKDNIHNKENVPGWYIIS
jgi:hypothetical protein